LFFLIVFLSRIEIAESRIDVVQRPRPGGSPLHLIFDYEYLSPTAWR
jgi:hypothetical protein